MCSSLTCLTGVVSLSKNINSSFVLVQPRKTRPFITDRKIVVRQKESNQTNKTKSNEQVSICLDSPSEQDFTDYKVCDTKICQFFCKNG